MHMSSEHETGESYLHSVYLHMQIYTRPAIQRANKDSGNGCRSRGIYEISSAHQSLDTVVTPSVREQANTDIFVGPHLLKASSARGPCDVRIPTLTVITRLYSSSFSMWWLVVAAAVARVRVCLAPDGRRPRLGSSETGPEPHREFASRLVPMEVRSKP
jgi:hypothetical protein